MKIGIVTMWDTSDNYGQILQCYALQHYLRQQGHDAFLIKSISDTIEQKSFSKKLLKIPSKLFSYRYWSLLVFRYKLKKFTKKYGNINRGFDLFRSKYIVATDKIYNIDMLETAPPICDAYITGSDQVWGSVSKINFLTFVHNKPKYSYAASFGSNPFTKTDCLKIKKMLSSFTAITVREEKGVNKCKQMGINAQRIIDPTGLLTQEDYLSIAEIPKEKNYILIYLLGNFTNVNISEIYQYASIKNLKVKYIASQARNDQYEKIFPSPTEWLGLIANAKYILTNSYHCCMFSIYFEKKFIFFKLTGIFKGMNSRLETLIKQYDIPQVHDLEMLENIQFNYSHISNKVNKDRIEGRELLKFWFL